MLNVVASQRIVRAAPAILEVFFTDQDGEPATAPTTVTVGITNSAGTVVVAPLTATVNDTANHAGRYTYTLAATNTQLLDLLTVTWTSGTTTIVTLVEIVGAVYFTVAEARAAVSSLTEDRYSNAQVIAARREVEDEFEAICRVACVPRFRQYTMPSWGGITLRIPNLLPRAIRGITTAISSFTTLQLANIEFNVDGDLYLFGNVFPYSPFTTVSYEHGLDRPPPEIKTAAFTRLRERINADSSGIPARATSYAPDQGGGWRLDTADANSTGNPEVDAVLTRLRERYTPVGIA